jgi:23S rRNA pseudouridine1911/1915/1917 synthase
MSLDIIYEDKYLIAVIKPVGMLSQSDGEDDVVSAVDKTAHIINRLDRPVGGIVLLARDSKTASLMTELMQADKISKRYLTVVNGKPATDSEELCDYLMTNQRLNLAKVVNKGNTGAKLARLKYKLLDSTDDISLLEVELFTGRHHQIRAQLAHHGLPIYGDTKYNPAFKHARGVTPALFAYRLSFEHPYTGEQIQLKALPISISSPISSSSSNYGKFSDFKDMLGDLNEL